MCKKYDTGIELRKYIAHRSLGRSMWVLDRNDIRWMNELNVLKNLTNGTRDSKYINREDGFYGSIWYWTLLPYFDTMNADTSNHLHRNWYSILTGLKIPFILTRITAKTLVWSMFEGLSCGFYTYSVWCWSLFRGTYWSNIYIIPKWKCAQNPNVLLW